MADTRAATHTRAIQGVFQADPKHSHFRVLQACPIETYSGDQGWRVERRDESSFRNNFGVVVSGLNVPMGKASSEFQPAISDAPGRRLLAGGPRRT